MVGRNRGAGSPKVTLVKAYPRGGRRLKKPFQVFNTTDTRAWFESKGVPLYEQDDKRVFPKPDDSQDVIDCLMQEIKRKGVQLAFGMQAKALEPLVNQIRVSFSGKENVRKTFDKVIVATGGSPRAKGLTWLEELGHNIESPVPSLFTFNMPTSSE